MRILKFLCTGGIGAVVNLGTLFILVDIFGTHYLGASVLAFCVAAVVGFLLQKYWTFGERSTNGGRQFLMYVVVGVGNIVVNTFIVYILTGILGLHYLVSQFIGAAAVAVTSYLLYRHLIFRAPPASDAQTVA